MYVLYIITAMNKIIYNFISCNCICNTYPELYVYAVIEHTYYYTHIIYTQHTYICIIRQFIIL